MVKRVLGVALVAVVGVSAACSSSSSSGGGDGGTGSSSGGGSSSGSSSGGGSDGGCTALPSLTGAPTITVKMMTNMALPVSAAAGGTIASGTYFETEEDLYMGSDSAAPQTKAAFVFDAATMSGAFNEDVGTTAAFTYTTSGTMLTTSACGFSGSLSRPYTAAGTTITLYDTINDRVAIFTKQ